MNLILLKEKDFINSARVQISGRRFTHIQKVHQAQAGDTLRVGKINGSIGSGFIAQMDKSSLMMEVILDQAPPAPAPVKLILALPRPKVLRRMLRDATTMGIKEIYLIKTWRVEKSYFQTPFLEPEKIREELILGLEQARDTILPTVQIKHFFKPFVEDEVPQIIKDTSPILLHPFEAEPLTQTSISNSPVTLAIGPEGGFIEYEAELLKKLGFQGFHLGKRIYRTETALPFLMGWLQMVSK